MRLASLIAAAISAAAPLAIPPGAVAQPAVIGNVAAANQAVIGTPPAATQRQLQLGYEVNAEERIETADIGAGQFVFLDQTTLSVWPNSDIVLDRYVYDPDRSVGEMSVTLTRGVLRFIGGRISKSADAAIRTPHGLVTVRGGIAQVSVTGGVTQVVHVAGEFTRLGDVTLSRPNALAEARVGPSGQVETRFVGVLDAAGVAALFGQPQGQGTGGLDAPPDDGLVGDGLVASGAQDSGSGDVDAPQSQPVSTLGEQQRGATQEGTPDAPASTDRQIPAAERVTEGGGVAPVEPPMVQPPVVQPPVVEPPVVEPPVVQPPVVQPPVVQPVLAFVGAAFGLSDADVFPDVATPATSNLVFTTTNRMPLADFFRTANGATFNTGGADAAGAIFAFDETEGPFTGSTTESLGRRDLLTFDDPLTFYLSAEGFFGPSQTRELFFFGVPTPPSVWGVVSGADLQIRRYDVSDELFTLLEAPIPLTPDTVRLHADGTVGSGLLLVPAPDAPLLSANSGGTKFVSTLFSLVGEGRDQRSLLGVYTSAPRLNAAGSLVSPGSLAIFARDNASPGADFETSGSLIGLIGYELADAGGGVTAFGPEGEYFVLGQGPFDDGAVDAGFFSAGLGSAAVGQRYGDTRLAVLQEQQSLAAADRLSFSAPRSQTGFTGANPNLTHFLTGGYATTATEFNLAAPYLLTTLSPGDVRIGFNPFGNGVQIEFSNLIAVDAPSGALTGVSLNFGNDGGRDAFLTDQFFATREDRGASGGITGQPIAANRLVVADANRSALTTAALVEDTNPLSPEFMTWGWWGTSLITEDGNGVQRRDLMHLGAWVAGVVSDIADVRAVTGTANYAGIAAANVLDTSFTAAPTTYVEQGAFSMTYDFADRQGQIAISGILGDSYVGALSESAATGANHFGGALVGTSTTGFTSGTVNGAFFTGAGSPVQAAGGSFEVRRSGSFENLTAVGVFAGDRID